MNADDTARAAEVVELGQTLFEAVCDWAEKAPATAEGEAFPSGAVREAADEFFARLRELLGLPAVESAEDIA